MRHVPRRHEEAGDGEPEVAGHQVQHLCDVREGVAGGGSRWEEAVQVGGVDKVGLVV